MNVTQEAVAELLNSEDFGDRMKGLNFLRQLDAAIAFNLIQPLVKDNNVRVRYAAVSQFDTIGDQDLNKSLEILLDRLYNDPEADVRAAAADAIAGLKIISAFPDLEKVYHQSEDWLIKFSIVSALGELGAPGSFDLLQEALESDNNLIQMSAISALGELGDPRAVELLIPFANHEDWQVRYRLTQALGHLGGETALATLKQLTEDSFEQVATEARNTLSSQEK